MPLTVRDAANFLLTYLAKEDRTIPPSDSADNPLPAVLNAINGAMIEMATICPVHLFRDRRSAMIHPPVTLTVPTVATGAKTFVLTTGDGWLDYMLGCSIQFNGGEPWNEIIDYDSDSHTVTLLHPVLAGGNNISAQIFCDSITLDADVLQVLQPVTMADKYSLTPVHTLKALFAALYYYWRDEDFGFYGTLSTSTRRTSYRPSPLVYFVDTRWQAGYSRASARMRLAPMPLDQSIIHYRARVEPPLFTIEDIYGDGDPSADPGTDLPVDAALVQNVFYPLALQRFTGSAYFRNDNAVPEISRQYQLALKTVQQMRPQGSRGFRIVPRL